MTAQQKLPETQRFLDLSKHGLGRGLSLALFGSSSLRAQRAQHPFFAIQVCGNPTTWRLHLPPLRVLDPLGCHEWFNVIDFQQFDLRLFRA